MTTYPLSEPATIYAAEGDGGSDPSVVGKGTLAECADTVAGLAPDKQKTISIQMDALDLRFDPQEVGELLRFLDEESAGLSNNEIAEIKTSEQ
ncbi:hypothetical protein [Sphingomonas sp. S2-65]|uniref:hypothetical protein n=1 Tax=Sphingomonas sp. S2-65 TaxID=2903960 RepID=UPI001F241D27|nr:hypothetical protein [Sphingomonas sp. S2-65]UYY58623.1 hypothetical protein LZ586_00440 [Sphingomonas sp. S2-65]